MKKISIFAIIVIIGAIFCLFWKAEHKKSKVYPANATQKTYIAIVIDDFGNGRDGTNGFLDLDVPYTGAVMPAMPNSSEEALALISKNKDVILHMPMEAKNGKKSWLGKNAITLDLSSEQINKNISDSIAEIKGLIGINNHMGSKAMEDERTMEILVQQAKANNLIIIDSKTTSKSKVAQLAKKYGVTVLERDIFLDSTNNQSKIESNLMEAANIAKKYGYCIAIGHVGKAGGKVTLNAIKNKKEEINNMNVEFVTISQLMKIIKQPPIKPSL